MTRFRLTHRWNVQPTACWSGKLWFFGNVVSGQLKPGMHLILPKPKGAVTTMVIENVQQGGDSRGPVPGLLSMSIVFEDEAAFQWWIALDLKPGDELELVTAPT